MTDPFASGVPSDNPYGQPPQFGAPQQPQGSPYGSPPPYGAPDYGPQGAYGQPAGYGPTGFGQPQYGGPYGMQQSMGTNGMAIASLVLGLTWIFWIGSVLAVIFAFVARAQIKRTNQGGGGLAIAGMVLGFIGVGTLILFIIGLASGSTHTYCTYTVNGVQQSC